MHSRHGDNLTSAQEGPTASIRCDPPVVALNSDYRQALKTTNESTVGILEATRARKSAFQLSDGQHVVRLTWSLFRL